MVGDRAFTSSVTHCSQAKYEIVHSRIHPAAPSDEKNVNVTFGPMVMIPVVEISITPIFCWELSKTLRNIRMYVDVLGRNRSGSEMSLVRNAAEVAVAHFCSSICKVTNLPALVMWIGTEIGVAQGPLQVVS